MTAALAGNPVPRAGDYALCNSCGEFCIITPENTLRPPRGRERDDIAYDERCIRIQATWLMLNRDRLPKA